MPWHRDSFLYGFLCGVLAACAVIFLTGCSGPRLYRVAQANVISAKSFSEIVQLEQSWYQAGMLSADDHVAWTRVLTLWGRAGLDLTDAIEASNQGQAVRALAELSQLAASVLSETGLIARLPEQAQAAARIAFHALQAVLSTMSITLEVAHVPTALNPTDVALVRADASVWATLGPVHLSEAVGAQ